MGSSFQVQLCWEIGYDHLMQNWYSGDFLAIVDTNYNTEKFLNVLDNWYPLIKFTFQKEMLNYRFRFLVPMQDKHI